jgi:hypothetical protein
MKITLLTPALAAILGFALASTPVSAQTDMGSNATAPAAPSATTTTTSTTTTTPAPKAKIRYMGKITAMSATSVTISGKKDLTLTIAPTTTFLKDKMPATAADFVVGDKITGSYSMDDSGAMMANSIHKKSSK